MKPLAKPLQTVRGFPAIILILVSLLTSSCVVRSTPENIAPERTRYNEVIRHTEDEQLLSNIVRLRYNDTPFFLDLGSVVVQYGVESRANAGLTFGIEDFFSDNAGSGSGNVGGGVTLSERPTVSYSPLQGESYARRLLTSIPMEVIWLLADSGWSIERLLVLTVERLQGLDNAPTASGPHPQTAPRYAEFRELASIARRLQQSRILTLTTRLANDDRTLELQIATGSEAAANNDVERLRQLLQLPEDADRIVLGTIDDNGSVSTPTGIRTRSMLGVLYFIANSIDVPDAHARIGLARQASLGSERFDWQEIFAGIVEIQHSVDEPDYAFVRTRYRDHWFYIDDRDADSKATFGLLQLLFSLQSTTGSGTMPLLTLPAN
jgi:hypothetical protein